MRKAFLTSQYISALPGTAFIQSISVEILVTFFNVTNVCYLYFSAVTSPEAHVQVDQSLCRPCTAVVQLVV